jgi:hypothetical protein
MVYIGILRATTTIDTWCYIDIYLCDIPISDILTGAEVEADNHKGYRATVLTWTFAGY